VIEINSQGYPPRSPFLGDRDLIPGKNPQEAEVPKMSEIFPLITSTIRTAQFPESAINILPNVSAFTSQDVARFTDVAGILSLLLRNSIPISVACRNIICYTKGT
jgi:hypothetical protein